MDGVVDLERLGCIIRGIARIKTVCVGTLVEVVSRYGFIVRSTEILRMFLEWREVIVL